MILSRREPKKEIMTKLYCDLYKGRMGNILH